MFVAGFPTRFHRFPFVYRTVYHIILCIVAESRLQTALWRLPSCRWLVMVLSPTCSTTCGRRMSWIVEWRAFPSQIPLFIVIARRITGISPQPTAQSSGNTRPTFRTPRLRCVPVPPAILLRFPLQTHDVVCPPVWSGGIYRRQNLWKRHHRRARLGW